MLGRWFKKTGRRNEIFLCTKFGNKFDGGKHGGICGTPEYVKQACEASLKRLGVDQIDLYYLHRYTLHGRLREFPARRLTVERIRRCRLRRLSVPWRSWLKRARSSISAFRRLVPILSVARQKFIKVPTPIPHSLTSSHGSSNRVLSLGPGYRKPLHRPPENMSRTRRHNNLLLTPWPRLLDRPNQIPRRFKPRRFSEDIPPFLGREFFQEPRVGG